MKPLILLAILLFSGCAAKSSDSISRCDEFVRRHELICRTVDIPIDLPHYLDVDPNANSKMASWLREGETQLDLWQNYRSSYISGWNTAVRHFVCEGEFLINESHEAYSWQANVKSGCEAFWLGYQDARNQIGEIATSA